MRPVPPSHPKPAGASLALAPIGNCAISALVDGSARIVWACMPRLDSDPVFHSLVDSAAGIGHDGTFAIEIENFDHAEQRYDHGTAVLRTCLFDREGQALEVCDFAPRFTHHGRQFRPAQIVRRVRPLHGQPRLRVIVRPRADFGARVPGITRGSHHLRFVLPGLVLRLNSSAPLTYVAGEEWFTLRGPLALMLGPDETLEGDIEETARAFEEHTAAHWREWTRRLAVPLQWQDEVIRAAITLKLCQYEETGAIVAALTTSIPEAPDSGRNWDYRYCWLRDAFFVVRALNSLSEVATMEDYLCWLHDVLRASGDGHVQPLYGIGLERTLTERVVSQAAGYRGMGPVRVGNQAFEHFQHDVWGNIVLGSAQAFFDRRLLRPSGIDEFRLLQQAGERAWALHDQPDAGMWELRSRARVHTSSAIMCWAACDRLGRIATHLGERQRAALWARRAQAIRERVLDQAWNASRGAFVESLGGEHLDASVLLMPEIGFIDARDPRFLSTLQTLQTHLADGHFMRRYEAADDLGVPRTSFTVCAFWWVDALARGGQRERAREIFETVLRHATPLGLLSEDIASDNGEAWGNFPQTYSMAGLIGSAVRLSRAWDEVV